MDWIKRSTKRENHNLRDHAAGAWGSFADRDLDAEGAKRALDLERRASQAHAMRVADYVKRYGNTVQQVAQAWRDDGLATATQYVLSKKRDEPSIDASDPSYRYMMAAQHFRDWLKDNEDDDVRSWQPDQLASAFIFFATGYATAVAEYQPEYMSLWDIFLEHYEEHFGYEN